MSEWWQGCLLSWRAPSDKKTENENEEMDKIYLKQPIIVEGRYDKIKLQGFVGSLIIATDGFRIFKDKEKQYMIRTLGKKHGLVILTDSDKAGLIIRNHIKSIAAGCKMTQVYIPQLVGKEARKAKPGKENLLGVEGMESKLLYDLFAANGLLDEAAPKTVRPITKQDLFADGLSGGVGSDQKRKLLMKELHIPPYLSANAFLEVCNSLLTFEEYESLVERVNALYKNQNDKMTQEE